MLRKPAKSTTTQPSIGMPVRDCTVLMVQAAASPTSSFFAPIEEAALNRADCAREVVPS